MSTPTISMGKHVSLGIAFSLFLFLFCSPAQAQSEEPPMEEITATAQRLLPFSQNFTMLVWAIPETLGEDYFLDALNDIALWDGGTGETYTSQDVEDTCNQESSGFRQECLDAAHTANMTCLGGGAAVTAYGAFIGILPGAISAIGFGLGCTQADHDAVNACNSAADNSTFPGASELCQ